MIKMSGLEERHMCTNCKRKLSLDDLAMERHCSWCASCCVNNGNMCENCLGKVWK